MTAVEPKYSSPEPLAVSRPTITACLAPRVSAWWPAYIRVASAAMNWLPVTSKPATPTIHFFMFSPSQVQLQTSKRAARSDARHE